MSSVSRPAELHSINQENYDEKCHDGQQEHPRQLGLVRTDLVDYLLRHDGIQKSLGVINMHISQVKNFHTKNKQASEEYTRKTVIMHMVEIMISTNQHCHEMLKILNEIRYESWCYKHNGAMFNLYHHHLRKFQISMDDYNIATDTFKSGLLSRETIILDRNLVEQNVDNDLVQAQDVTHSSE